MEVITTAIVNMMNDKVMQALSLCGEKYSFDAKEAYEYCMSVEPGDKKGRKLVEKGKVKGKGKVEREEREAWDKEERLERDWVEMREEVLYVLKSFTREINLSKLNIRKDFSLINTHASALRLIAKAEGREGNEFK